MDELWLLVWAITLIWLDLKFRTILKLFKAIKNEQAKEIRKPETNIETRCEALIDASVDDITSSKTTDEPFINVKAIKTPPRPQGGFGSKV